MVAPQFFQYPDGPQVGDTAVYFRTEKDHECSPIVLRHAILAALRQAGMLPSDDPEQDAKDIAEFNERGKIVKPTMITLGQSGWNRYK